MKLTKKFLHGTWIVLLLVVAIGNAIVAVTSAADADFSKGTWHLMLFAISAYAAKLETKDD